MEITAALYDRHESLIDKPLQEFGRRYIQVCARSVQAFVRRSIERS